MKKLIAALLLSITLCGIAYGDSTTTRLAITKPSIGSSGWGTKLNSDFDLMDGGFAVLAASNTFTSTNVFTGGALIGINTTTPQNKLDVNGAVAIGSYGGVNAAPANGLIVSGPVGIGTNTVQALLDIRGVGVAGSTNTVQISTSASGSPAVLTISTTGVPGFGANLTMNSNKITTLAASSTNGDAVRYEQVNNLWGYRKPSLVWISTNAVDVENNTGTANQTTMVFRDGVALSVTEATSNTAKYRRFVLSNVANFTSGSELGGLRSGVTNSANTWYAIYAVKSQINAANFVVVGDTMTPSQANYSTLNTNYGTNGWIYLGMLRNGDGGNTSAGLLNFVQSGNTTLFQNTITGASASGGAGLILAKATAATSLTYTYASGTGATQIPGHITFAYYEAAASLFANKFTVTDSGAARQYFAGSGDRGPVVRHWMIASEGEKIDSAATSTNFDIDLAGYVDGVLGVGTNVGD